MIEYFDFKTTCLSCGKREKLENRIVCDYCRHENESTSESFEDEE